MFRRLNMGAIPGYAPICVDSNDPDTIRNAFTSRLLRELPEADDVVLEDLREFVRSWVRSHVPRVNILEFEEWLASTTSYNEARKQELREAFEGLRGGFPTAKQCAAVAAFIKTECYGEWKNGRVINSRCDAFKVFSGPAFKAIENALFDLPYFAKHLSIDEKKRRVADLVGDYIYETDFSAMEASVTSKLMDCCEFELYRYCLEGWNGLPLLLGTLSGVNRIKFRNAFAAFIEGRRMSGETCTSLGNGFTTLMLLLHIAHRKGLRLDALVEGDDGLVACNGPITKEDFAQYGFICKMVRVRVASHASFCGLKFAESGEVIRDPVRFLQKFGWTHSCIHGGDRVMDGLLHAKSLSALYETPQCPIVGKLARECLAFSSYAQPRFEKSWKEIYPFKEYIVSEESRGETSLVAYSAFEIPPFSPSYDTRLIFEQEYGITVECQLAAEAAIEKRDWKRASAFLPVVPAQVQFENNYVVAC